MDAPVESARTDDLRVSRWISRGFEDLLLACPEDPPGQPDLPHHYDIVVIGSGYGGSIAAAELTGRTGADGKPTSLCLLERGAEYLPGMFPVSEADLPGHVRFSTAGSTKPGGQQTGLLDLRLGPDVCALVANGLGGGSLINAGVMEPAAADAWTSDDGSKRWPTELRDPAALAPFYTKALTMLGARKADGSSNTMMDHPQGPTPKFRALQEFCRREFRAAALSVSMRDHVNAAGVKLNACARCGDCAIGCNQAAKNSLDENLLVQAYQRGADIFTGATVRRLRKIPKGWGVEIVHTDPKLRKRSRPFELRAGRVILSAGTFGSTEILLRSAAKALPLSKRLGQGFSTNGDMLAAAFDQRERVDAVADQGAAPATRNVGPTITGLIDLRARAGTTIEEFAIPGPLRRLFSESFTVAHTLRQLGTRDRSRHVANGAQLDPLAVDPRKIAHTQVFGLMGHDGAAGALELVKADDEAALGADVSDGAIRVRWPKLRDGRFELFDQQMDLLEKLRIDAKTGGEILPNIIWRLVPPELESLLKVAKGPAVTVHPLGGCCMGDSVETGVVNHLGQVFAGAGVHDGLVVLDGSIIPTSLGVNPALTIAAVALRAVTHLRPKWGLSEGPATMPAGRGRSGERPRFRMPAYAAAEPTEVQFIERLSGIVKLNVKRRVETRVVELTLQFRPLPLRDLMGPISRTLAVDPARSQVRTFTREHWHWLTRNDRPDSDYDRLALDIAGVEGTLRVLDREASTSAQRRCRALRAWFYNRGMREILVEAMDFLRGRSGRTPMPAGELRERAKLLAAFASRAGEVRTLGYDLTLRAPARSQDGVLQPGQRIAGGKRFTYSRRGNPWTQLQTVELERFPGLASGSSRQIRLDPRFLAGRGVPLFQIVRQADHGTALFEIASFLCYLARLFMSVHGWNLRKYDPQPLREPQRLPAEVPGLPRPEINEIEVDRLPDGTAVRVRMTRYPRLDSRFAPVVMIHGYSASGNTFAHHAVDPNLAGYLWKRGRDIWILDLRTSSGMPTARHPWKFEQAALEDIPVALDYIQRVTQRPKLDIVAHCMGSAMLTMALLGRPGTGARYFAERERLPGLIQTIVLSQVAPVVVFSPANVFRAYVMGFLREMFDFAEYEFRPLRQPTPADEMLDRLLATLPYPEEEYDIENPLWPWRKTDFVRTRHRMDALYGRDFNLVNIPPRVMNHIDDLFGPLSMKTVLGAIHFARNSLITDSRGRNVFVTRALLRKYWADIPTLCIHGEDNGLADVGTLFRMTDLMSDARVKIFKTHVEPKHGHQDCLIGRHAHRIFREIERFLNDPQAYESPTPLPEGFRQGSAASGQEIHERKVVAQAPEARAVAAEALQATASRNAKPDPLLARIPWLGPIRGATNGRIVDVTIAADPKLGEPLFVACVAVVRANGRFSRVPLDEGQPLRYSPWRGGESGDPVRMQASFEQWPTQAAGALVLFVYDQSDIIGKSRSPRDTLPSKQVPEALVLAVDKCLGERTQQELEPGFLQEQVPRLPAVARSRPGAQMPGPGDAALACSFALGSCQYPSGPFDSLIASASYRRLNELLDSDGAGKPSFLVLTGDQIYSDPTAGLIDPVAVDDRYVIPHQKFLRDPEVSRVLSRLPSYMMLDDHEIGENWEPAPGENGESSPSLRAGRAAYLKFQRTQGPANPGPIGADPCPLWYEAEPEGLPFFFADTRTGRRGRDLRDLANARIMSDEQLAALLAWIDRYRHDPRPKFIVSASMFLPTRVHSSMSPGGAQHADAWEGFAHSRNQVLAALVADGGVGNLVFLSGDEHHSSVTRIEVKDPATEQSVICHSLHSSALYAPFVFANGNPEELYRQRSSIPFRDVAGRGYLYSTRTEFVPGTNGFAVIDCLRVGETWRLRYRFHLRDATTVGELD